jgi:hypothetical protein
MIELQGSGVKFLGPPVDDRGVIRKQELRIGSAESLAVLAEEYAFFTPAVLYMYGQFYDGPLVDLMYERQENIPLYYKKFHRPIFRGLETPDGDTSWNHAMWAVRRDHLPILADFIIGITFVVHESRQVIRFGEHFLTIADPLAMDRAVVYDPRLPRLSIRVFGVNGSRFRAALKQGKSALMDPPTLQFYDSDETMKLFADATFNGRNPLEAQSTVAFSRKLAKIAEARRNENKT